ncbi:MAG TPA: xanthine dehydrogenase family protein subunit M [Gemmatimonadales bacterium]|nr:xanthine dehydrogenase family protein subunit M [Gemmatimonadales bacterium]
MKPAAFEYLRPGSVDEALELLERHGADAKPLAGGQSLVPAMNFRLAQPAVLVDLNGVADLAGIAAADGGLRIGAMTRQRAVERSAFAAERAPLLAETLPFIAHPQIRNRGTVGGSLAHADPAAELPAVMVAAQARLLLRRRGGERRVEAERFFTGLFATALEPGELLTAVELPAMAPRTGWAFAEVSRRHGDYALVGVACLVTLDGRGRCASARVALLSVGEGPVLAPSVAAALAGAAPTPEAVRAAAEEVDADVDPPSDIHASAAYRRRLARVLTRRALTRAFDRAASR